MAAQRLHAVPLLPSNVCDRCISCWLYSLTVHSQGLKWRLFVKILAAYTLVGYVGCQLAFFTQCHPFKSYWQIAPSPNLKYVHLPALLGLSANVDQLHGPV